VLLLEEAEQTAQKLLLSSSAIVPPVSNSCKQRTVKKRVRQRAGRLQVTCSAHLHAMKGQHTDKTNTVKSVVSIVRGSSKTSKHVLDKIACW
jgi:hypothetical protein